MGLRYKDLVGILKPTLYIDEFSSKISDDDEIVVLSFYVTNNKATDDLIKWFEKSYDYIIDADKSPGEISPNRYLVFVEIERKYAIPSQIKEILDDLNTLTEHELKHWKITYNNKEFRYNKELLEKVLDLSPYEYRHNHEKELNEMRVAANLPVKPLLKGKDADLDIIRAQAGLL